MCFWGSTDLRTAGRSLARRSFEADEDEATTRRSSAGSTPRQRPPRMSTLEATAARERCIGIPRPRQQGGPQGRLCRRKQQQQAQEGYSRRRQGAAIAAARREAAEAKAKTKLLEAKMKTMEATLSRVAAMLPSLERLQRRENAAATRIQAALQGHATRSKRKQEEARLAQKHISYRVVRRLVRFFLRLRRSFLIWHQWVSRVRPWEHSHLYRLGEFQLFRPCPSCVEGWSYDYRRRHPWDPSRFYTCSAATPHLKFIHHNGRNSDRRNFVELQVGDMGPWEWNPGSITPDPDTQVGYRHVWESFYRYPKKQ